MPLASHAPNRPPRPAAGARTPRSVTGRTGRACLLALVALAALGGPALAKPKPPRAPKGAPSASATPAASAPAAAPSAAPAAPSPATPPTIAETLPPPARREYEAAKGLFALGDAKGAFYKFQAAYELFPDPRLLWNMATCAKTMHAYADALRLVRRYQSLGGGLLTPADRAEAEQAASAFAALTTTLIFRVSEPGAEVSVDGTPVEAPTEPFIADLGPHKVTAKKAGFQELTLTVSGKPTVSTPVELRLVAVRHEGTLIVNATPADAAIFIDGRAVAVGHHRVKLPSGGYLVRVTAKGRRPFQQDVQLRDDETRTLPVALEAEGGSGVPTWLIVLGSAAVVGAGVGTTVYFATRPSKNDHVPTGTLSPGVLTTSF